jgi:hypothetical protein
MSVRREVIVRYLFYTCEHHLLELSEQFQWDDSNGTSDAHTRRWRDPGRQQFFVKLQSVGYKNEMGLGDLLRRQLNQNRALERGIFLPPARRHNRCPRLDPDRLKDAWSLTSARFRNVLHECPPIAQKSVSRGLSKPGACSRRVRFGAVRMRTPDYGTYYCPVSLPAITVHPQVTSRNTQQYRVRLGSPASPRGRFPMGNSHQHLYCQGLSPTATGSTEAPVSEEKVRVLSLLATAHPGHTLHICFAIHDFCTIKVW